MPSPPRASAQLTKFISKKRTLQNAEAVSGSNVVSRYQIFNLSGFDYKGQISCAYGISGAEGTVTLSLNLLALLAPLLPIANLEVAGSGSFAFEKQRMVVLHRFPAGAYPTRVLMIENHPTPVQTSLRPQQIASASSSFSTATPLSLLPFQGAGGEVTLKLSATAGRSFEFLKFIDEANFELVLEAKVSGVLKGYYKRLRAPYVSYFTSPNDINAIEAAQLEKVVDSLLYNPDKRQAKEEVEAWLDDMVQNWLTVHRTQLSSQVQDQVHSKRERARQKLRGWASRAKGAAAKMHIPQATETVEGILNDMFLARINFELRLPALHQSLDNWLNTRSTMTLLDRLRELQKEILASTAPAAARSKAWRQARRYEELLLRFYRRNEYSESPNPALGVKDNLSLFKTFSFSVGGDVSGRAGIGGQVSTPEVPNAPGLQLSLQGETSAKAEGNASAQFILYRYQATNKAGNDTLVYTQDTRLAYRRWSASADAMAKAGFGAFEYSKQKGATKTHLAFTYSSLALFWIHRFVYQDEAGLFTHPLNGSGLCRGMSVSTKRLIELAQGKPQSKLERAIGRRFGLTGDRLRTFLNAAELATLDPAQPGLPANLILEVGYPFSGSQRVALQQSQRDGVPIYDVLGRLRDSGLQLQPSTQPEWIRLRIRMVDVDDSKEPIFKLGFPVVLPKVSIDASRIRSAGQDALFDYYVHWLNNTEYNTKPNLATWAQELSVPPTVFLHQ